MAFAILGQDEDLQTCAFCRFLSLTIVGFPCLSTSSYLYFLSIFFFWFSLDLLVGRFESSPSNINSFHSNGILLIDFERLLQIFSSVGLYLVWVQTLSLHKCQFSNDLEIFLADKDLHRNCPLPLPPPPPHTSANITTTTIPTNSHGLFMLALEP